MNIEKMFGRPILHHYNARDDDDDDNNDVD